MATEQFDFIVVGAGSAGCVLANRLTDNGKFHVLLLEAGRRSHFLSPIPISFSKLIDHPTANWCYQSQPDQSMGGRTIPVPRGRLLGGSSSINGLVYVRGQPLDYDTWAQFGNPGWSFKNVLPIFKRLENYESGADDWRNQGGPLHIRNVGDSNSLYDAIFEAGEEIGLPRNYDYNGADQNGIGWTQTTIRKGIRMSTAVAYLRPVQHRKNLRIVSEALVEKLTFDGLRCTGVQYRTHGQSFSARATAETILSAGSINTPQLLELSGIGNPSVLSPLGIKTFHSLPGVGENLRDHIAPRIGWTVSQKGICFNDRARGLKLAGQVARYAFARKGFLSLPSAPLLAFFKSRASSETPDAQLHIVPYTFEVSRRRLQKDPGITFTLYQLRPESLGSVHIKSAEPTEHPRIIFNFLTHPTDQQVLIDGFRVVRKLVRAKAFDKFRGGEFKPGNSVQTDEEIIDWIRATAETAYHPVGTCRMGPESINTVVNHRLKVHGLEGLRIADGSIMPTLTSGNTNAPCIMIGEKAADMIQADWH